MYYVYILKSLKDGKYYYGSSKDPEKRLTKHNKGDVRSTKGRRPWVIHYIESHGSRSDAYRRELYFKSIPGHIWLKENFII